MTYKPGASSSMIIDEAKKINFDLSIVSLDSDNSCMIKLTKGSRFFFIFDRNHFMSTTLNSALATTICKNKEITNKFLKKSNLNSPDEIDIDIEHPIHQKHILDFIKKHSCVTVKPASGTHGDGVKLDISNLTQIYGELLNQNNQKFVIQQQVSGSDYRLLFVDYQPIAAVKRIPAHVIGNGISTITQLIIEFNKTRKSKINVKKAKENTNHPMTDVLKKGEFLSLAKIANISVGGTIEEVSLKDFDQEQLISIGEAMRSISLRLCGVDLMSEDISDESKNYILELNSAPGITLHKDTEVPKKILQAIIKHRQK